MPAETKYRAGQPLIIELFAVINDGQPAKQVIECINIMMSGCPALYFVSAGIYQLTDIDERTSLFPD
jgi:hypothetical protein